jgi:hypothetical protein
MRGAARMRVVMAKKKTDKRRRREVLRYRGEGGTVDVEEARLEVASSNFDGQQ